MATDLKVVRMTNQDERFYRTLGPFLSRRAIVSELGAPVWDDDGKEWFLAYRGRKLVGFAALRVLGQHQSLVSAYVLPEHRRSGVYTRLILARVDAATLPIQAIATPEAVPALKKAGLKSTGKRGHYTRMRA